MLIETIKEAIAELPNDWKQPKGKVKIFFIAILVLVICSVFKVRLWKQAKTYTRKRYTRYRTKYRNYRKSRRK